MSGRPSLKLTFGKPKTESPAPSAQSPTPSSGTKLKLKFTSKPTTTKDGQAAHSSSSKPKKTSKAASSKTSVKKRAREPTDDEPKRAKDDGGKPANIDGTTIKRIKFSTKPKAPTSLKLKSKGAPPARSKGAGYDSEASDTEIDPSLEEEFILRMQPGEDCEYLRKAIEENRFGPRSQGGADVSIKALTRDGRRAVVTICGHIYAAVLVDLPTIIEGMKSWDKRGWYKSADIVQMLLVLGRVESDQEALKHPLPRDVDSNSYQYAHGLTPPLRWVKKRRFRKRISNRTIEAVELEVARLLKEDMAAIEPPKYEIIDQAQYNRQQSAQREADEMFEYEEEDVDGEEEGYYEGEEHLGEEEAAQEMEEDLFEDELAAEMEAELAAHADASSVPASITADTAHTPGDAVHETETEGDVEAGTPQAQHAAGESSGDDDSEESGAEDANEELDADSVERQRLLQQEREELEELEEHVQVETERWEKMFNPILKTKLGNRVRSLTQALELKRVNFEKLQKTQ